MTSSRGPTSASLSAFSVTQKHAACCSSLDSWHITFSKGPKAFVVALMLRYGSTRVVRLGSASGALPSTRGPHRSIRTPGRSGKTNFLLRFWRTAQTISGSRRTKSCRVWCGISRSSGPLEREIPHQTLQLFVRREPEIVWAVLQKRSKKFVFPDLPGVRILLWGPRVLGSAPEALPSLTTLVDP